MLVALPQEFASGLQAHRLQTIELLVQTLGSNPNSGMLDLGQPLGAMTWSVDACARTANGPASVQRFDPIHGAGDILGYRQITAPQLLKGAYSMLSVVHRLKFVGA